MRTTDWAYDVTGAYRPCTAVVGVQVPVGPPKVGRQHRKIDTSASAAKLPGSRGRSHARASTTLFPSQLMAGYPALNRTMEVRVLLGEPL